MPLSFRAVALIRRIQHTTNQKQRRSGERSSQEACITRFLGTPLFLLAHIDVIERSVPSVSTPPKSLFNLASNQLFPLFCSIFEHGRPISFIFKCFIQSWIVLTWLAGVVSMPMPGRGCSDESAAFNHWGAAESRARLQ